MKPLISVTDLLILGLTLAVVIILLTNRGVDVGFDLYGGSDADTLIGDPGDNLIWGGPGADIIDGGDGIDTVDYRGSKSGVEINLSNNSAYGGDATGDSISNIERIFGSNHDDLLTGDDGYNVLLGNAGSDILDGRGGNDRLEGGMGKDIFIFHPGNSKTDSIIGFANGEDRIDLTGFGGLSFNDLAISAEGDDSLIDLSGNDGSRIILRRFNPSDLDPSDFLFAR